jgi:hypothetical protein
LAQQGAGQGHALTLASGEQVALVADLGFMACRE